MTNYASLLLEVDGGIATVTINRPNALNALSQTVMDELEAAFTALSEDDTVRGVLLTGAGEKAFVAGADISEFGSLGYEEAVAFSTKGQRLFAQIEGMPKPVVAAINGFALGGGCELAMACHLRVAAENAKFGQPEVNLGLIAGYGGTQRLTRLIGETKALELLLTGDMLSAADAEKLGLVNAVVPAKELIATSRKLLEKILKKAPLAVAYTLAAVNAYGNGKGYETEAIGFAKAVTSADGREGTRAFLEKRAPNFQGK